MTKGCWGHNCKCQALSEKTVVISGWVTCMCGHCAQAHTKVRPTNESELIDYTPIVKTKLDMEKAKPVEINPGPKPKRKYTLKKKPPAKSVSVSDTGLTPAQARAKLRAAGIEVGSRGRLSPEQMAQAAKL